MAPRFPTLPPVVDANVLRNDINSTCRKQKRRPLAALIDLQIRTIGTLYQLSDYPAPYIGAAPQIVTIPRPLRAVEI